MLGIMDRNTDLKESLPMMGKLFRGLLLERRMGKINFYSQVRSVSLLSVSLLSIGIDDFGIACAGLMSKEVVICTLE